MKTQEARELGRKIAKLLRAGCTEQAYTLLSPILAKRTRFAKLRLIGDAAGAEALEPVNAFLERVAADKTEGGWVVIASGLEQQLARDLAGAFVRCRRVVWGRHAG